METKQVFANSKKHGFLLGLVFIFFLLALVIWQVQEKTASALACDSNAVGTNVMVGCEWQDINGDGKKDGGDKLIGPARQNPPSVKSSPANTVHYQALGWWGFSYHHYGCCQKWLGLDPCYENSCDLVGSHPLAVSGVDGWGYQDNIPKSVGIWKGNFTFDNATYIFRISGDFSHPRRLYIDNQFAGGESGSVFLEKQMTPGTHKLSVEYSQDNDASLGFTIFQMVPSLVVSPTTASIAVDQTKAFTASFDPDGNSGNFDNPHYVSKPPQNVTATAEWTSSDPTIASVTSAGQVKGLKNGTVTITAKYPLPAPSWTSNNGLETYNGIRDTSTLTVTGGATPDTTLPTVSITAPAAGATVSGSVNLTASASDDVGVAGVQFKVDQANIGAEDTSAPYSVPWNTASYSNASHSITATARDAAGNTKISTAVAVTVNNGGGGGGTCSGTNCGACTTQTSCPTTACTWTGSACVASNNPPPEPRCTNFTGYASNCDSSGTQILALNHLSGSPSVQVSVSLQSSPVNVIYKTGYYWSPTRNQWMSFALTGTAYSGSTAWFTNSASANLNIPRSDLATGANYILTWDYIRSGTCWVGPEGTCGTGKWRIAVFNVQ